MSSRRRRVGPTGLKQLPSAGDGDNKEFVAEEITKEAVPTIARGMPGVPVTCGHPVHVCARLRVHRAPGIPCALILFGRQGFQNSGAGCVAGNFWLFELNGARLAAPAQHTQPSSSAKAEDPVFRGVSSQIEVARDTPRLRGDDGLLWIDCWEFLRASSASCVRRDGSWPDHPPDLPFWPVRRQNPSQNVAFSPYTKPAPRILR